MKKVNLLITLLIVSCISLSSCSSDDNNNETPDTENPDNTDPSEITAATLTDGVTIDGATLQSGTPPAPNGALDFQISTSKQEAFLTSGFNISFTSTDQIAGAYLQFKDIEGNNANGYYDVPASAFGDSDGIKSSGNSGKKKAKQSTSKNEEENLIIDVDFEDTIPVGSFCYVICLYDDNGNISQIQEVCVDIEAWGGNSSIVGEWIHVEDTETPNLTNITCDNQEVINDVPLSIINKEEWLFVLNEDGSYYEIYDDEIQNLNLIKSQETCTKVYKDDNEKEKFSGKWSYNNETETFTAIDFKYEDLLNPSQNQEYPDGDVYFEGVKIELKDGFLIITETYEEGSGTIEETYTFRKK